MSLEEQPVTELEMDRLRELTNIGAGQAATAFSRLAGRQIVMGIPRLCVPELDRRPRSGAGEESEGWDTGVFFEFEGGMLSGLVGILFRTPMRESLVRTLLGEGGPHPAEHVESALMEVGNILVSRVASAIADTLGTRILPSVPTLVMEDAGERLGRLARRRAGADLIRVECELMDERGELGGLLVLIPDESRP